MDLIYIILSVFLRLSPAVRKLSSVPARDSGRQRDMMNLAFWLPLVGWVSVSVQHCPTSRWLVWRVREVNDVHFSFWLNQQDTSWMFDSKRERKRRWRRTPGASGDSRRNRNLFR